MIAPTLVGPRTGPGDTVQTLWDVPGIGRVCVSELHAATGYEALCPAETVVWTLDADGEIDDDVVRLPGIVAPEAAIMAAIARQLRPHRDLLDVADVARLLDMDAPVVHSSMSRAQGKWARFPAPWATFSGRPVWLAADVEAWRT